MKKLKGPFRWTVTPTRPVPPIQPVPPVEPANSGCALALRLGLDSEGRLNGNG